MADLSTLKVATRGGPWQDASGNALVGLLYHKGNNDVTPLTLGSGLSIVNGQLVLNNGPAPTGTPTLTATPGNGQVGLSWTLATGATNSFLYRYTSNSGTPETGALIYSSTGTSDTDTGVTNETTYWYQVFGWNNGVLGPGSAIVQATPGVYLLDTFHDTNGTGLTSHLMDVGPGGIANELGWAYFTTGGTTPTYQIQSNQCEQTGGSGTVGAVVDSQHSDGTISVSWYSTQTSPANFLNGIGAVFRWSDANNYLLADMGSTEGLTLYKCSGGSFTSLGSYSFTPVINTTYTVKVVYSGTSITVYLNGTSVFSVTNSFNQTSTKCGIKSAVVNQNFFTNFELTL